MVLRYPVMLTHGFGMNARSITTCTLWGAIPDSLREAGTSVWFSTQDALGGVEANAHQLAGCLQEVCDRTGADKVHLVAHSKGGPDARAAIAYEEGFADHVASLITLSAPHLGLHFVDSLAESRFLAPYILAPVFNGLGHLGGDKHPAALQVADDLTTYAMRDFGEEYPFPASIPCYSYGFIVPPARGLRRLDLLRRYVRRHDGENDGFVALWSTEFERWVKVHVEGVRDFTHDDAMDRRRIHADYVLSDGREFHTVPELIIDTLDKVEGELSQSEENKG